MGPRRVVLATRNAGKLTELRRLLAAYDVGVAGLDEVAAEMPDVVETGATFTENALLKARAVADAVGEPAVADDSGLCVDALNGMPGVLSARWAGRHGDDAANRELLIGQLADVPDERRGAHFTCVAALVVPGGGERTAQGQLAGTVVRAPRGTGGFGYDPVFRPEGESGTAAELSPAEKDAISHRGRALHALAPRIAELLE